MGRELLSVSLFTGAFGLDLGVEWAGFTTVAVVERDEAALQTVVRNRPHLAASARPRDVRTVRGRHLLDEASAFLGRPVREGDIDLLTGGPPCQSFSTAGRRGSLTDPRGGLLFEFVRLVRELRPRYFLMENVRGLLSAPIRHRPHARRGPGYPPLAEDEQPGSALRVLLDAFTELGYRVTYALLQAADYGVPQIRERVFFIGSRDCDPPPLPAPTHDRFGRYGRKRWRTLRQALEGLDDPEPEYVRYSESRRRFLRLLQPGQNWRDLPPDLVVEAMGRAYVAGGGKCGFYRRLSWDKPSPTVTTAPHQKATDLCHPDELRPLSVRECARVQTLPDEWFFVGSTVAKYRQVGNAVPPLLAYAVAVPLARAARGELSSTGEGLNGDRQLRLPLVGLSRRQFVDGSSDLEAALDG